MKPLAFLMPNVGGIGHSFLQSMACEAGDWTCRRFPDGETYIRYLSPVKGRDIVLVCALDNPDDKFMQLYLAAQTARELGARRVGAVIPYLPYMRQDARFHEGEGISSVHFAALISSCCDWLVTVDPHLHRHHDMADIYTVPTRVVHAAPAIARWIELNVEHPVLIGPDSESRQWVAEVAALARCDSVVLEKTRLGDRQVSISQLQMPQDGKTQPVVLDDIVSTGVTMLAAVESLRADNDKAPVCIAVHPLLVQESYAALLNAGIDKLVSCNTVSHPTNRIDLGPALAQGVRELLFEMQGIAHSIAG